MSRKLAAGLFICLLFGFQADKFLNNLNCPTRNINDNNTKCDCEKQIKDLPDNDQQPNPQKTVYTEKAEDLFLGGAAGNLLECHRLNTDALKKFFLSVILRTGYYPSVFQPPDLS